MTKEELEKEAEVFVSEKADKGNFDLEQFGKAYFSESSMKQTYIVSAEPREKRIVELEATNKKISEECHKLVDTLEKKQNENELLETQNIKLQSEVSILTIKNAELKDNFKIAKDNEYEYSSLLTKAKEIIKELVRVEYADFTNGDYSNELSKVLEQAEQFLNSEVNNALS